jgi:hypothetical protein
MSTKDEVNGMMAEAFMEDVLPKITKFIPMVKTQLENSEGFLKESELILIGKNSKNQFKVIKFSKEDYNSLIELVKIKEKLQVWTLEQLLTMLLNPKK